MSAEPLPTAPLPVDVRMTGLKVFVRGLRVEAEIGLYDHERGRTQPLVIDAALTLAPSPPQHLRDTLNYELVASAAEALANGGHIELVETFAERLALACLADPRVLEARVRIEKPDALRSADAAGAEIVLLRTD